MCANKPPTRPDWAQQFEPIWGQKPREGPAIAWPAVPPEASHRSISLGSFSDRIASGQSAFGRMGETGRMGRLESSETGRIALSACFRPRLSMFSDVRQNRQRAGNIFGGHFNSSASESGERSSSGLTGLVQSGPGPERAWSRAGLVQSGPSPERAWSRAGLVQSGPEPTRASTVGSRKPESGTVQLVSQGVRLGIGEAIVL